MVKDHVGTQGDDLIIESDVEMPDWEMRAYRRLQIVVDGQAYFVAAKSTISRGRFRYQLVLWPETLNDLPGRQIYYDETFIQARDEVIRNRREAIVVIALTWFFRPLLGYLWQASKERMAVRFLVDPVRCTELSIYTSYAIVVLCMAMAVIGLFTQAIALGWLVATMLLLAPDTVMRWDRMQRDRSNLGFYEWWLGKRD